MALGGIEQLHFRGVPPLISVMQQVEDLKRGSYPLELGGTRAMLLVRPMTSEAQHCSLFKLKLSQSTPPGIYQTRFAFEDKEIPIVVDVGPRENLRFVPASLSLTAKPGEKVESELSIANTGNTPFDLGARHSFCVFDSSGIDHAFFAALSDKAITGGQRLDRLMDELADSHGGLVRLTVREGATSIGPGEAKPLHLALDFSDRLRPGHSYSGSWSLLDFKFSIQVRVINGTSRKEKTNEET